jgi:hypothetical protein
MNTTLILERKNVEEGQKKYMKVLWDGLGDVYLPSLIKEGNLVKFIFEEEEADKYINCICVREGSVHTDWKSGSCEQLDDISKFKGKTNVLMYKEETGEWCRIDGSPYIPSKLDVLQDTFSRLRNGCFQYTSNDKELENIKKSLNIDALEEHREKIKRSLKGIQTTKELEKTTFPDILVGRRENTTQPSDLMLFSNINKGEIAIYFSASMERRVTETLIVETTKEDEVAILQKEKWKKMGIHERLDNATKYYKELLHHIKARVAQLKETY